MRDSAELQHPNMPTLPWGSADDLARDPDGVVTGWGSLRRLHYRAVSKLEAVETIVDLGLHPIILAGIRPDGSCTCGRIHDAKSIGKHPSRKSWQTAALNLQQLRIDLERDPWANVGLRMGPQPNGMRLVAIDVDGSPELLLGAFTWDELPPTLVQQTARGFHLIYRVPDDREMPKNAVRLAPGIDIRSEGGQIVCAPSIHHSGARYRFTRCQEPAVLT